MAKRKWKNPTGEVINGKWVPAKPYRDWSNMMARCKKGGKFQQREPSYTGCVVCEDWLDYDVFFEWYNQNYVDGYALDKDILFKANKVYSPNTCCFVPQEINSLFTKSDRIRGELPIGVSFYKNTNNYNAYCKNNGIQKHLGYFNTPQEAFEAYKHYKESLIKQIATEYYSKNLIEEKVYQAMMNYEVEITD